MILTQLLDRKIREMTGISLCQKIFFASCQKKNALPLKRSQLTKKEYERWLGSEQLSRVTTTTKICFATSPRKNLLPIKRLQLIKKWFGISRDQLSRLPTTGLLQSPLCDPPASHTFTSPCRPLLLWTLQKFSLSLFLICRIVHFHFSHRPQIPSHLNFFFVRFITFIFPINPACFQSPIFAVLWIDDVHSSYSCAFNPVSGMSSLTKDMFSSLTKDMFFNVFPVPYTYIPFTFSLTSSNIPQCYFLIKGAFDRPCGRLLEFFSKSHLTSIQLQNQPYLCFHFCSYFMSLVSYFPFEELT